MSDWTMGPDGIPFRNAARVILFDAQGNTLLIEGHDKDNPSRHWWFTVGGGLKRAKGRGKVPVGSWQKKRVLSFRPPNFWARLFTGKQYLTLLAVRPDSMKPSSWLI